MTTVAEAAFQHLVGAPNLLPLAELASIRVVRCRTDNAIARERVRPSSLSRSAHADASVLDDPSYYDTYRWLELEAPSIEVDTTGGYDPTICQVADWVASKTS